MSSNRELTVPGVVRATRRREPSSPCALVVLALVALVGSSRDVCAQQSVNDTLSFLLTNRSIATGDFAGDALAASVTRDTISVFLLTELGSLPVSSAATGFTYEMDPALGGVATRTSESFGPLFTERALTSGARHGSFGVAFQHASFDRIDGRSLDDGTLVATASRLVADPKPFDVEALTLRLRTNTLTFSATAGLTDRLDVTTAVPVVSLTLDGQRVDTYRGTAVLQATASASASGLGDVLWRAKYNVLRHDATAVAVVAEGRLPTGRAEDLLGAGRYTFRPRLTASLEAARLTVNADVGYLFGSFSREFDYGAGITAAPSSRVTVVGELVGRRLNAAGHLTDVTAPHPSLTGVETIRLTAIEQATDRLVAVAGLKVNIASVWVVTANVSRFLTDAGLTTNWIPAVAIEYFFGG
jgi:hypothetical protein